MTINNLTLIPFNLPGKVYRSPMPFGTFDLGRTTLQEYLESGIDTVVMLIESGEDLRYAGRDLRQVYSENQLDTVHFPIEDFNTPEDEKSLANLIKEITKRAGDGENLVVHCFAGRGRTGMVLAMVARQVMRLDGQAAIDWVRQFFPAIETAAQERLVRDLQLDT